MPGGFKDLSELHIASVESGQPEMFHKVLEVAMWRADREYELSSSSSTSLGVDGDDEEARTLRVERFSSLPKYTGAQPSVIQGIFPKGFPTSIYGEGGIAKSTIALHMCMSIASGQKEWLGYPIEQQSPCLYVDFEMDREEQGTRAERLAKGMGIEVPDDLYYLWASGFRFSEVFPLILEAVDELGVRVITFDSLGMALEGDALKGAVVIDFFRDRVDQLKRRGVSVLIVDHQSGLRPGESYQNKAQYGSVYKGYLSRSRLQLELDERDEVGTRVIVRQNKTNFGPPQVPFVVRTLFEQEKIVLSREALSEESLREESVLNATDRVLLCLLDGPSYPADLQEKTNLAGVGNIITKLKRKELVELTGEKVGKADEVRLTEKGQGLAEVVRSRLSSSSSHTPSNGGGDDGKSKKTKEPKSLEEEDELRSHLAGTFNYAYTSSTPPPDGEGSGNIADAIPKEARRTLITTQDQLAEMVADLKGVGLVTLDLETTGLDPRRDSIRLLSLATDPATYIVDCQSVIPAALFPILTEATVVAHNVLFDLGFLSSLGFEPGKVADTMILSQLLRAGSKVEPLKKGQTSHSLDSVVKRELGLELDKTHQSDDWGGTLTPEMIEYAAKDVEVLLPLYEALKAKIEEAGLTRVAEIEHRALPAVVWMSSVGIPVDADGWREHARKTEAEAARLKDELHVLAPEHPEGKVWNFGSHQQVRKAAKLLGVDLPNTKDETLALYAQEHEFIAALRNYRKAAKLASTYGAAWLENGYHKDGRIYASWRQLRAATGRMACDHPNLQNIPRSGPLRSYIRTSEGRVFVIADYSQIELRIATKISGDTEMLSAYAEGRDLHTLTAQHLTGRVDVSKDDRRLAKAVNFGLLYGMGSKGLQSYALRSYGVEMSPEQASLYRRRFFETYPALKRWHERERQAWLRDDTETRTLTGRRRMDVERLTDRLNAPVQGAAADGLKLALALLWERRSECPGAVPVLVCHDEIVVECDMEQAMDTKIWLEKAMIEGMDAVVNGTGKALVPIKVEARIGRSWGERN
jgi:DNA polymerase I-like protein with 3'-5' exonuclease and polymerase domains/KaiC/GvpD/RAD55 family RecA-like ATPase